MSKLEELIQELCPGGVEDKPIWEVTTWDKKFNSVERFKQPEVISYPYLLANDLFSLQQDEGNVFLLSTGEQTGWTTEDLAGNNICEGEVVTIPWGKSRHVVDVMKYYKGKFVTADNRIATSNNTEILMNKFLFYWMQSQGEVIDSFYRGSGLKHPSMKDVLDMRIPIPPLEVQREIVKMLDNFTELTAELIAELTAELTARKQQYEYYRDLLLTFDERGGGPVKSSGLRLEIFQKLYEGLLLDPSKIILQREETALIGLKLVMLHRIQNILHWLKKKLHAKEQHSRDMLSQATLFFQIQ